MSLLSFPYSSLRGSVIACRPALFSIDLQLCQRKMTQEPLAHTSLRHRAERFSDRQNFLVSICSYSFVTSHVFSFFSFAFKGLGFTCTLAPFLSFPPSKNSVVHERKITALVFFSFAFKGLCRTCTLAPLEEWGRTKWPNDGTSVHQTFDNTGPTGPT